MIVGLVICVVRFESLILDDFWVQPNGVGKVRDCSLMTIVGTLRLVKSVSSREEFDQSCKDFLIKGDTTDHTIARVFYSYVGKFVMATGKKDVWQLFDRDRNVWREEHRDVIMDPVIDHFAESFDQLATICNKMSTAEKDPWFLKGATNSLTDDKFDSVGHIINRANAVYDLKKGEFREGRPEDYCKKSTKLNFTPYDEHPAEKKAIVEKFISDIMLDDPILQHHLLKVLSSPLDSKIKYQFVFSFIGKGSNGKSLLIKLLKKVFGDYNGTAPSAHFTNPNTDEIPATARAFIALNNLPTVTDTTGGFWRKVVLISFAAKFTETPNPNNPNEKQLDEEMEEKLMECADTFLPLLIKYHVQFYKTEGIPKEQQPQNVMDAVLAYRYSQDIPLQFLDTCLVDDPKSYVETKDIHENFRNFCSSKKRAIYKVLVGCLEEMLDERYPPKNAKRQTCTKRSGGRNLRVWDCLRLEGMGDWNLQDVEDQAGPSKSQQPQPVRNPQQARADRKQTPVKEQEYVKVEVEETDDEYTLRKQIEAVYSRPCWMVPVEYKQKGELAQDKQMKLRIKEEFGVNVAFEDLE
ncbi:hypothetical protein HDV00_006976 [Rhizophlyctis rosea]|nr:hypothetical protein HDV00_006976 [Rhizophlyctis rosea]